MLGLYESISALATKINRLCCAVKQLQDGGGGSYKVYTALVTWDDTGLTDLNVLENTLGGDLSFVINISTSEATVTSINSLFTTDKTFVLLNSYWDSTNNIGVGIGCKINSTSELLVAFDAYGSAGTLETTRTGFIEIRIYK
jgi:hypothetical protein